MGQPKQNTANPPLFPVGSNIVFEWLFDNATLVFPPANLTVEISLTSNPKMIWPVANVSGTATSVVWNTATVMNPSLFMGYYTLYDTFFFQHDERFLYQLVKRHQLTFYLPKQERV